MAIPRQSVHELIHGRQHHRILRLSFPHTKSPPAQFVVNKLDATESLSKDFSFIVELLSDSSSVALKDMLGKLLNIELVRADGSLRYFSGYVFAFRRVRSDGGLTFYEATLGPWMQLLALRKNCYLFHNRTIRQQTEIILAEYGIHPRWDWLVREGDPVMTDACQFNETDFNYLSRRWEAAGWYYWYEHDAQGHKLIVGADTTMAPAIDGDTDIRFHAAGGAAEEDAIDSWSARRRMMPSVLALSSFNFKYPLHASVSVPTLNKQGLAPRLESYTYTGAYGFKNLQDGDAQSRIRIEELEAIARLVDGEGNNRRMQPGRWFRLTEHFNHRYGTRDQQAGKDDFLILTVRHVATNNYLQVATEKAHYRNWFTCTRRNIPWRPGRNYNSTDTRILAPQTAIVVGPKGRDAICTDPFGRVRVQFHWDRAGKNDDCSSTWIRVSSAWAGAEQGLSAVPRIGSEVIVQWLDGNPDRPIITGAVFNERNMPPWSLPHQDALSGFRTRELAPKWGNSPNGRSNYLIFDDTHQGIQVQLGSEHLSSQLSLGSISRIEGNEGRREARGEGWELRTDGWGVVRAGKGMLITTEARQAGRGPVKDMDEIAHGLALALEQHQLLAEIAQNNGAQNPVDNQEDVASALRAQNDAVQGTAAHSGGFPELEKPHLVLSSPLGISTTTAGDSHVASGRHMAITTGKNVSIAVGTNFFASIRQTFRLFVQKAGMKLVAAAGDIDVQALSGSIKLLAKLEITHTANRITISATEEIVINGAGSYAKFTSGGIEHGTSGAFVVHAADHTFANAKSMDMAVNMPPITDVMRKGQATLHVGSHAEAAGRKSAGLPFKLFKDGALVEQGKADDRGNIQFTHVPDGAANYKIEFANGQSFDIAPSTYVEQHEINAGAGYHGYENPGGHLSDDTTSLDQDRIDANPSSRHQT